MNITRLKQIRLFIAGSIVLIFLHLWANNYYSSTEKLLNNFSNSNHMGSVEEILLQEEYKDGTILLGKAENGLVYLSTKESFGYSKKYEIISGDDGWAFADDGVIVKYIDPLERVYGYSEIQDITRIVCWTGKNSKSCDVITLLPEENGLFVEAPGMFEKIEMLGSLWKPGGSVSWGSDRRRIYAVEGFNKDEESVYWYSEHGFIKDDFYESGLTKKIYDRVINVD